MTKLFHQCGHNTVWNLKSLVDDKCGDGLILSPVHYERSRVEKIPDEVKRISFFDPQYYLPNSQKSKFQSYDFFPETLAGGFVTSDFTHLALESAKRCIEFQLSNNFSRLIIPARHFSQMITTYQEKQDVYTVRPFLQIVDEKRYKGEVFLTLPITAAMIEDANYKLELFNWVTSYPRIDGLYLLVEDSRKTKQICDGKFLYNYIAAVKELIDIGLKIIVGHVNTEGVLFTLIDECEITFGAYENTRMFNIDKFIVEDEERRGPKPRIYLAELYNWILVSHAKQIRKELPKLWKTIYSPTDYSEKILAAAAEPNFNTPELYKHFFKIYSNQVNVLNKLKIANRYKHLRESLLLAREYYEKIEDAPIDLDKHGNGQHIQVWLDTINQFKRKFI